MGIKVNELIAPNVIDRKSLIFVGKGIQGKVYRIDAKRCIKFYNKGKYLQRELACLRIASGDPLFPTVYEWGSDYMIREFIEGMPLADYLKIHPMSEQISRQLLVIFHTLERLQYRRLDIRLDHLIINSENEIRLIDPTNLMHMRESYPKRLLAGLRSLKLDRDFIEYVKKHEPQLAEEWASHS